MNDSHDQHQAHASHSMLQLFGLLLVLLAVVILAVVMWEGQTVTTPVVNSSSTPTEAEKKTETDEETGFSFEVPKGVSEAGNEIPTDLFYQSYVEKVSTLPVEAPTFQDRAVAESDQAALLAGQVGSTQYLNPFVSSMKVIKIDNQTNAKTFVSFGSGVDCTDRHPVLSMITYKGGYRILFQLFMPADTFQASYPTYFANDPICTPGDTSTRVLTKSSQFYADLTAGKLDGIAADWYTTFNTTVSRMTFEK